MNNSSTRRPIFAFWLNFSSPAGASQPIGYAIADENGFEAPMIFDGPFGSWTPGGFSKGRAGLVRGAGHFPACSRKFFLRLYQQAGEGKRFRVAEFSIKNNEVQHLPTWKPQDLPTEQQTNGLAFSLVKASVGVTPPGEVLPPYDLQAGEWSEFRFRVSARDQPSGWTINEMIIGDSAGSHVRVSAEDNGSFNSQFSRMEGDEIVCLHRWEFWSEDPAWKLNVQFERPGQSDCWIEYLARPEFLTPLKPVR